MNKTIEINLYNNNYHNTIMEFLNANDCSVHSHFPNVETHIPCISDLFKTLIIVKPDITFYLPLINGSVTHPYKIIYTNYDFYIHATTDPNNQETVFCFYNLHNHNNMGNIRIYHSNSHLLYCERGIKTIGNIIKDSKLENNNQYIKLDKMIYMNEIEKDKELKTFFESERKQFLKDRHESDQIIGKLDNKILQYKDKIRELESQPDMI